MTPPSSNRPPLYLMHGMWCTGDTLQDLAHPLREEGFRVDAPTLPDHSVCLDREGRKRLARASLLDYAAFHLEQIAALPPGPPPVLIGHSMGGLLAQIVASRIPISGVVLLAPAAPAGFNLIQPCSTIATGHVLARYAFWRRTQKPPRIFADYGLFHRLPRAARAKAYKEIVWESGRAYSEIVFWFLDKQRASAVDPRHLMAPMLVLSAEHDRILPPRVIERVADFYPQAHYEELADLGHMMFVEPGGEVVATRVLSWLAEMSLFGGDNVRANELLRAPLRKVNEIAA
jgi:pimeloyl-ACP methyl ester carboxylesterase